MKSKFKKVIVFLMILILSISCFSIFSYAVSGSYSGSGSSGHPSNISGATGGFSIYNGEAYKNIIGYRFSVFDLNTGNELGEPVDVYDNSWRVYGKNYDSLYVANPQRSKTEYYRKYKVGNSWNFNTNSTPKGIGGSFRRCAVNDATYGARLKGMPQNPANIKGWIENTKTNDALYELCQYGFRNHQITPNTVLLVEPIIQAKLSGKHHALTTTELAVYGGFIKGFNYKGHSSTTDIDFINSYICRYFPNLLYYSKSLKVSGVSTAMAGASSLSNRATYGTIVSKGYGLGVFTPNKALISRTVKYTPRVREELNTSQTVSTGTKITIKSAPSCSSQQMLWSSWYDTTCKTNRAAGTTETINSNHEYLGQCAPYRVKFSDTGKIESWDLKVVGGYWTYTHTSVNFPNRTKNGYKFLGWSTTNTSVPTGPFYSGNIASDDGKAQAIRAKADSKGVTTLYPVYVPYMVYYDVNLKKDVNNKDTSAAGIPDVPINLFSASQSNDSFTYSMPTSRIGISELKFGIYKLSTQYGVLSNGTYYLTIVPIKPAKSGTATVKVMAYDDNFKEKVEVASAELPTRSLSIVEDVGNNLSGFKNLAITLEVTKKFSGGTYAIYLTKGAPVTDDSFLNYAADKNNFITSNSAFVNAGSAKYIALPSATAAFRTNAPLAKPFGYDFVQWKNGASAIVDGARPNNGNVTVKANWTPTKYNIRYDKNGGTWNEALTPDNHVYKSGYFYRDSDFTINTNELTISSRSHFDLKRTGYIFTGWKVSHNGKIYSEGDKAKFADLLKSLPAGNTTITLEAQWKPIKYTLSFWTDLGPNEVYVPYISSGYSSYETKPWGTTGTEYPFNFASNKFYKASDTQELTYDTPANINENKFSYTAEQFHGWHAYNENTGLYAVKINDQIEWHDYSTVTTNNEKLYIFADKQEVVNLTCNDGDTIRMFASHKYANPTDPDPDPTPDDTLTPNNYYIYYCGDKATSNNYTSNVVQEKCQFNNENTDFVYQDITRYSFDLINENSKNIKEIKFARTGYHYDVSALWVVTRLNADKVEYLSDVSNNVGKWSTDSKKAIKLVDLEVVRNLSNINEQKLYAHVLWAPNTYKVVYCGNADAAAADGYAGYVDPNFGISLTPSNCHKNFKSKDYEHSEILKYDTEYTLYDCKFKTDKTGYRFYGWSLNPNQKYDVNNDMTGYIAPTEDAKFAVESETKDKDFKVKNLTVKDNDTVYLYAVWGPIQYEIIYDSNEAYSSGTPTGKMDSGAYVNGTDKIANWCFYDKNYVLRPNAFISPNSSFLHWEITDKIVKDSKLNGTISGEPLSKLASIDKATVVAQAKWGARTTIYYNINVAKPNLIKPDIKGITLSEDGYFINENDKSKINSLKVTENEVSAQMDSSFPLKDICNDLGVDNSHGYTFNGWTTHPNGTNIIDPDIFVKALRNIVNKKDYYANAEITLYQNTTPNNYKVYYCGNGATESHYASNTSTEPHNGITCAEGLKSGNICKYYNYYDDTEWTYDIEHKLVANQFYKEGYLFAGWATTPDGEVEYTNEEVVNIATSDNEIVWLYAVWAPTHVYYNLNLPTDVNLNNCLSDLEKHNLILYHANKENPGSVYNVCDRIITNGTNNSKLVKQQIIPSEFSPITYTTLVKDNNGIAALSEYKFIGWSKNKDSRPGDEDIIYPGQKYKVKEFIEKYFDDFSTENCLYAIWAQSSINIQYRVEDNGHYTPKDKLNSDKYILNGENVYTDVLKNASASTPYNVKGLSDFRLAHTDSSTKYYGWELHRFINGEEYYFTNSDIANERWKKINTGGKMNDDAFIFEDGYNISNIEGQVDFESICGSDLITGNVTLIFVARCEAVTDPLFIQYVVDTRGTNGSSDFGSETDVSLIDPYTIEPYATDSSGLVRIKTSDTATAIYSQAISVPAKIENAKVQTLKLLETSIASRDFYHVSYWTTSPSKDSQEIIKSGAEIKNTDEIVQELKDKAVDGVVTLYAHWEPNKLIVRFSPNGGTLDKSETSTYISDDIIFDKETSQPVEKTKEYSADANDTIELDISSMRFNLIKHHYSLGSGWKYDDVDYENTFTADEEILRDGDKVVVLKANWKPNTIKIVYHVNDGTLTNPNYTTLNENGDAICETSSGVVYTQLVEWADGKISSEIEYPGKFGLVRTNYNFKSWNTVRDDTGLVLKAGDNWNPFNYYQDGQTIHLYAQWEPAKYTINYCGNGADGENYTAYINSNPGVGTVSKPNEHINAYDCHTPDCNYNFYSLEAKSHAEPFSLTPNMFYKNGCVFSHWVDKEGNAYYDGATVDFTEKHINNPSEPIFLYAVWEEISYTIVYDGNNETDGFVNDQDVAYSQTVALNENEFIKDYYHFDETKCWIATRVVDDVTLTCTAYYNGHATWEQLDEESSDRAYLFEDKALVKTLTDVDDDVITMTAQWIPNVLIIKYDTNGGSVLSETYEVDPNGSSLIHQKGNSVFKQKYTYTPDNLYISLHSDSDFGMYKKVSEDGPAYVFNGWSLEGSQATDFDMDNLSSVSVLSLAENLIDEEVVEVTLYASWGVARENVLQYWEGEEVTYNDLVDDIKKYCEGGSNFDYLYTNDPADEPDCFVAYNETSLQRFDNLSAIAPAYSIEKRGEAQYISRFDKASDQWRLYTYFEKLSPGEVAKIDTSYVANGKIYGLTINIIYNNPPQIEAYDRWFTVEDAQTGKITELELLRTAIATDAESDVSNALKIKNFDASVFKNPGEYEVTYTVTDNIPVKGFHKSAEKTVVVHIVENYANVHARFIDDDYYVYSTLNSDHDSDVIETLYAKKLNGVLYFTDENGTFINDENDNPYPVDSGFKTSSKVFVNSKGVYTIIPLSKWYRNENYVIKLRECLNNNRDEDGNWDKIEETWFFKSEDVKAIRDNIKENVIDPNFYSNQYANGHCISYTNKAATAIKAKSVDEGLGRASTTFFSISDGKINGFDEDGREAWKSQCESVLRIPEMVSNQKITEIGKYAFTDNEIKTVYIPDGVTINSNAFSGCSNLNFVYIGQDCQFFEDSFPENTTVIKINQSPKNKG